MPRSPRLISWLIARVTGAWREGIRVNELILDRPWEREGELRWRRDHRGYTLLGTTMPSAARAPMAHSAGARASSRVSGVWH